ncbi:MAG: ATP-binding cassette domain-containing protein [Candidatus Omnitrophota bacterium]
MNIVEFRNVWEKYRIKFIRDGKVSWDEIWALKDVSFTLAQGEVLGIIGPNGAGKTTLLKLVAGSLVSDKGEVCVNGRVAQLMELGAGFNPEFTGRENIVFNAKMYGLDLDHNQACLDEVIAFAGLDRFIDAPVKCYSQGMYMRLAFALAIYADPDILLIDDILSVGDEEAQQKCLRKIYELKDKGKSIILVSHNMQMVARLCHHVILLEKGKIAYQGSCADDVVNYYLGVSGPEGQKAVAVKNKLKVVFNNGRMMIAFNDAIVTQGVGWDISFMLKDRNVRFFAHDLLWRLEPRGSREDRIIALGYDINGALLLTVDLIVGDGRLDVKVSAADEVIKELRSCFLLKSLYEGWVSGCQEGSFGFFLPQMGWHSVVSLDKKDRIAGIVPRSLGPDIPLMFEAFNDTSSIEIANTGVNEEARVVQLLSCEPGPLVFSVYVFDGRKSFDEAIAVQRGRYSRKRDEEQELQSRQEQERQVREERLERQEQEMRERQEQLTREEQKGREREESLLRQEQERQEREECLSRQEQEMQERHERLLRQEQDRQERLLSEQQEMQERHERLLCQQVEEKALWEKMRTLRCGPLKIFVDTNEKIVELYYYDELLTSGTGLFSNLLHCDQEQWFSSESAHWSAEKESDTEMVLTLDDASQIISQLWTFSLKEGRVLDLTIAMIAKEDIGLARHVVGLKIKSSYRYWQTQKEKGELLEETFIGDIIPVRFKDSKLFSVLLRSDMNEWPSLFFDVLLSREKQFLSLLKRKTKEGDEACAEFSRIVTSDEKIFSAGKHLLFEGRLFIGQDKVFEVGTKQNDLPRIVSDKVSLVFDDGRSRLYYDGLELTTGLGGYTSLRSGGIWHDSSRAFWQVKECSACRMVVVGEWVHLPIKQIWTYVLKDGRLSWGIEMEVYKGVALELMQTNIMLDPLYENWSVDGCAPQRFADDFSYDYDILPFRSWYGKSHQLIAGSSQRPKIIFEEHGANGVFRGIIENTDVVQSGRLLQYQQMKRQEVSAGLHKYFNGRLYVEVF